MSDTEQLIRERAYQLWQQAGCPEEHSEEFWFAARREIEGDVPPVGDRPGGAIDFPPEEQTLEEPPSAAAQRGQPVGMPGERIAEAGVMDERLADLAVPDARPAEPDAAEAPVPASAGRLPRQPAQAARAAAPVTARRAGPAKSPKR